MDERECWVVETPAGEPMALGDGPAEAMADLRRKMGPLIQWPEMQEAGWRIVKCKTVYV